MSKSTLMPEKERQALLRFADFESRKLEAVDDTAILMMQLALYKLAERDPIRVARIIASALTIYGDVPAAVQPKKEN